MSRELSEMIMLAGIPPAFAAPQNNALWNRAASLLENDGVRRLLERNKIDPDRVAACVKSACR